MKERLVYLLLFLVLGTFYNPVRAQFQVRGNALFSDEEVFAGGSVGYWWRLKNYRMEFFPSFLMEQSYLPASDLQLGGELITKLYLLDFKNDCNCPTFSKSGVAFKKGIHLEVSPGFFYPTEDKEWGLMIGGGIGYDIGLSDLLTIVPMVGLRGYFINDQSTLAGVASLGFIFRPDYVKEWH